jgi:putative ABC transport system permease protein
MFNSYFKIALRNLRKQKVFAFINVFGLSIGIACFILLLLFTANEYSFDKFHKNAADIYRPYVWYNAWNGTPALGYTDYSGPTNEPLGTAMKRELPDVLSYTQMQLPWGENLLRTEKNTSRINLSFADSSFFSIFSFPLKYGNSASALREMNAIVLTETKAKELFGSDEVVGKMVQIQIGTTFQPFRVTAVAEDMPPNSTIRFDVLGNFLYATTHQNNFFIGSNWHPTVRETYVQLKPGSGLAKSPPRLANFLRAFDPDMIKNLKSVGMTWSGNDLPETLKLQPLLFIHTDIGFKGWAFTDYAVIDPATIWILLAIATSILLIACINFTTLAIGRSAGRSKEVGVRKVIGAAKRQILFQFLSEAVLLSIASTVLGVLLAKAVLPWFNHLSARELQLSLPLSAQMFGILISVPLLVGLLAGMYPALVLSGFKPADILKNKIRIGGSNLFTKSLVSFQFALSIVLIVSTIIILQQSHYLINKNPGFNKENIVAIDAGQTDPDHIFPLFKQAVLAHPEIVGITSAAAGLGAGKDFLGYSDKGLSADINIIDSDYIKVMGMRLVAGSNFKPGLVNDTTKPMIINETMMTAFGWNAQNAVGKEIRNFQGGTSVVIGVVKNFNYRPLSEGIGNQVFIMNKDKGYANFYIRIGAGNLAPALYVLEKAWSTLSPGVPLKYSFLDEDLNAYYKAEQKWSNIVAWAGGISIFLASLGLLGLAALAAINRTKEVGVRKVLGASVSNIITLLLKDFMNLILIAFLVATPIAWYCMNKWLADYANRIHISWTVFAAAGVFVLVIALLTIGYHAMRAALANPVRSLRTE